MVTSLTRRCRRSRSSPGAGLAKLKNRVAGPGNAGTGDPAFDRDFRIRTSAPHAVAHWCTPEVRAAHAAGHVLLPWSVQGRELLHYTRGPVELTSVISYASSLVWLAELIDSGRCQGEIVPPSAGPRGSTVGAWRSGIFSSRVGRASRPSGPACPGTACGGWPACAGRRWPQLAGVSVEYYIRLERGHCQGISDSVLAAVARALQLDDAERQHLFDLVHTANGTPRSPPGRSPRRGLRCSYCSMR